MNTCTDCQIELEKKNHGAVDELPDTLVEHVETCTACQKYQQELAEMHRVVQLTLAPTLTDIKWQRIARRARWVARRPYRKLAYTLTLTALTFVWGFFNHPTWFVTGGLLLAVLPKQIADWKKRRNELRRLCAHSVELFATVADELRSLEIGCVVDALLYTGLAALFLAVAPFANDLRPPLVVAAFFFGLAWYKIKVRRRQVNRMQSELTR